MVGSIIEETALKSKKATLNISFLLSAIFILSFFFHQFSSFVSGVTVGELLLIIGSLIILFSGKRIRLTSSKGIVLIYILSFLFSLLVVSFSNNPFSLEPGTLILSRWIRYGSYALFYLFFCDNYDATPSLFKFYKTICLLISIYAIIQTAFYYLFHIVLPYNLLPFLNRPRDLSTEFLLQSADSNYFRAYGVFDEPAYMAEFLIPCVIMFLYEDGKSAKRLLGIMLLVLAILASTSVQGIIILIVSLVCSFLIVEKGKKRNYLFAFVLLITCIVAAVAFLNTKMGIKVFSRITRIGNEAQGDYSSKMRLFRGFVYWGELDIFHKLFGVGMGNAANFAAANEIYTEFDYAVRSASNLEYMNGLSRLLVEHGFFCFLAFVVYIVWMFFKTNSSGKTILIAYLLMLVSGSGVFTIESLFYIFFITSLSKKLDLKKKGVLNYGTIPE